PAQRRVSPGPRPPDHPASGGSCGSEPRPARSVPQVELVRARERPGDLPRLLLHARYHLAQQAEPEEDDPTDDHDLDQIQQRAEPEAEAKPEDQRGDPGEQADQKEDHPPQTKKEHRLASETKLKPDRDEVEDADRDALPVEL